MANIEILSHPNPYALNGMPHSIPDEEVQDVITIHVYDQRNESWTHLQYRRVDSHPSAPDVPRYAFIRCV